MQLERLESGPQEQEEGEALLTGASRDGRSRRGVVVLGLCASAAAAALALLRLGGPRTVGSELKDASLAGEVQLSAFGSGYIGNFPIHRTSVCTPGCKNGGVCMWNGCRCNGGWQGSDCSDPAPAPYGTHGGTGCNMGFDVFPYAEAEHWGTKYSGWEQCAGKSQSPINIISVKRDLGDAKLPGTMYANVTGASEVNNGHALEVDGTFLKVKMHNKLYTGSALQFHHPSEHHLSDQEYPLEMQIVTTDDSGSIAIIAIFFTIGHENECLKKAFEAPPKAGCAKDIERIGLSCFADVLGGKWYSYEGSITTPPCTEGVQWVVMKSHAAISHDQLEEFQKYFTSNNRPIQEVNGRTVTLHER